MPRTPKAAATPSKPNPAKRGRPPIEQSQDKRLLIRFTDEQKAAWQVAADAAGLPLTTWLKSVANVAAKKIQNS